MKKILLVDDHSDIRHLVRVTLGAGYDILEAEDGMSALSMVRNNKPHFILLDVMMPGELDGFQVLDILKSDPLTMNIPVVMVTARGQHSDHEEGIKRGAEAYFIKPFSPLALAAFIKQRLS